MNPMMKFQLKPIITGEKANNIGMFGATVYFNISSTKHIDMSYLNLNISYLLRFLRKLYTATPITIDIRPIVPYNAYSGWFGINVDNPIIVIHANTTDIITVGSTLLT